MILRCVCWSVFLCLALRPAVKAQVEVNEHGYQNVLISFTPNVPSDNGHELVQSLKELLEEVSSVLHNAIGIPIASVTFLLPPSWSTEKFENIDISAASSAQIETRPDISVDATEQSPFGKQPVALQHGGCGVHGHQITLPLDFLGSSEEYPKGKLLAREWLKYRYGVFDENGFKNDQLYPDFYRIPGSSEITITECTDSNVTYTFKKPGDGEACEMDSVDLDQCLTHPDNESAAIVTSSLMYFHKGFQNMEHICGKDEHHPHQDTLRSKQNALCNGQSIWDVVKLSEDFKTPQQPPADTESIQFSFVQESKPRFVVLLENSDNLLERAVPIAFALRRFYYDLPPKSKLAIYTYTNAEAEALPYAELPSVEERAGLATIADFAYSQADICTSCGLVKATQILLTNSEVEKGSILLITASSLDNVPTFDQKLKDSGICLNVLKFQGAEDSVDESYEPLRDLFSGCFSYQSTSSEDLESFNSVYSFLKSPVPESNEDFEIKTVVSGNMSGKDSVTIPQDAMASLYTLWLGKAFASSDSVQCKAGDVDVTLTPGKKGTDVSAFTFDPVDNDVTCILSSIKQPPILSQVQMTTKKGHYFVFDTWIHDKSTENEQLPIKIYAKIYFGGYPVKDANVKTVVTSADNPEEIVTMLDNGRGDPDITQHDGVYSGYFTGFLTEGEYQITVKIDDNGANAKIGKGHAEQMSTPCCGSEVIISQDEDVPAFEMEKHMVYTAKNKMPDDGYPPSRIVDLQVGTFNLSDYLVLTWTAPGGGKAERYALKLFLNRENAVKNFDTTGQEFNTSIIVPGEYGKTEEFVLDHNDLEKDTTYYVTMRSWNGFNKSSEISNVAEFFLPQDGGETIGPDPSPTPKGIKDDEETTKRAQARKRTIEIVVGVLAGVVVACILVYLVIYFFVQKPKRKEEKARARKKAENGGGQRTSSGPAGQIGLNSIPADVIIKHHNEVQEAKSLHKDPPIFKEESLDSSKSSPDLPENARRNNKVAQYTMVQKVPEGAASNSSQQDPSKSPKRMTVV